jgi:hypothetical protein
MQSPPRRFARAATTAIALVTALFGCGGGGDGGGGSSSSGPEGEIKETIITSLLEGDCDVMTDKFLRDQVLIGDDNSRAENCELFENLFIEKQYDADDVKITDVEITGSEATAVVGDDFSNIESTYTLVKKSGRWRIDSAELT